MNDKKRLIEALNKARDAWNSYIKECESFGDKPEYMEEEFIAEYLINDNGVIVPPCKVGDEVYCIVFLPAEGRLEIGMGSVISMEIRHEKLNIRIADCEPTRYANLDITVDSRDFGKTVFFSEAEAKYALKNRRSVSLVNGHIEE